MATVAQVLNRTNPQRPARWLVGTVTAVDGRTCTVNLDSTTVEVTGLSIDPVPAVNARVVLVATGSGNFILGTIGVAE